MARRLVLAVVSLLLALAGAEALARRHFGTTVLVDDGRRFATRPGTRGTNAWGFAERAIPPGADPSVRRVAVLGDSMTWGTSTPDRAWPRAAEAALGAGWQVLNFSHYGYDATQSAAVLTGHAARWAPDVVVYAAYGNDLVPTRFITVGEPPLRVRVADPAGRLPGGLGRSALVRLVDGAARSPAEVEDPAALRRALAAMAEAARGLDASFLVWVQVPHVLAAADADADALTHPGFAARALDRARRVEAEARALGLDVASARPYLRGTGRAAFHPPGSTDPEHPGPAGHAVLGRAFADLLARYEAGEPLPGLDDPPVPLP